MELSGRTALVTGGTSDIGAAIVRGLARRGADVIIHTHRALDRAAALRDELTALDSTVDHARVVHVVQGDLTVAAEVRRIAAEASAIAPIDIVVNNAGTPIRRVHWTELDADFLDLVFALNYRAPLYLTQALTPGMILRGRGVIINILSTAAHLGGTDTVFAYASAKGALLTLTRGLARALAAQGVRVLSVAPGTVDTGFQRTQTSPAQMDQLRAGIPLGRIGRPEEIGEVVAFLATDFASFIVGETVEVNGGLYMA